MSAPELAVVIVAGTRRARAQRALDAVGAQTARKRLELVVVDLAGDEEAPFRLPEGVEARTVSLPDAVDYGAARAAGVRATSAPAVAFLEDHCYPEPGWADALLRAHAGPAAAIGYAFTNANPGSRVARAGLAADYGRWMHPARDGPTRFLPGNNVSYTREALDAVGDLADALGTDFTLHELLRARGHVLATAADAVVAHENFETVRSTAAANYAYCRLLGANRARGAGWGPGRRIVYGVATPVGAPAVHLARLLLSLRGRRSLWPTVLRGLPVAAVVWAAAALGEARGYLTGPGEAPREMLRWEAEAEREPA